MRRTTTAWIAGTLGAGLTASIVLAQQLPSSSSSRAGAADAGSSTPKKTPSLYGAAGARGARYLMRNGLDYLNYQQYERALKFLREAEVHKKELTDPEIATLKEGIELARKGMRAAADAGSPYALSEQSQHRNGFTAARPEIAVAQRSDPPARTKARSDRALMPSLNDDPGDPIRLTSGEASVGDLPARPSGLSPARSAATASNPETATAEIPMLTAPEIPTLTAIPSLPDPAGSAAAAPAPVSRDPAITGAASLPDQPAATARNPEPSPVAATPAGPSTDAGPGPQTAAAPATGSTSPSPVETTPSPVKAPAPIVLETLEPTSNGPASPSATGSAPSSGGLIPTAMQAAPSTGSVTPASGFPAAAGGTGPGTAETETIPLPPLSASPSEADSPAAPAPKEPEEPAAMAPAAEPSSPSGLDGLPPLPADLARDEPVTNPSGGVSQPATAAAAQTSSEPPASPEAGSVATHGNEDPLPQLPIGVEAPVPAPIATTPAPIPTETTPATATAEPSPAAAPAADPQAAAAPEPTPAPTGGTNPVAAPEPGTGTSTPSGAPSDTAVAKPDTSAAPISADSNFTIPERATPVSTLNSDLRRKVEEAARNQDREETEQRLHPQQNRVPDAPTRDTSSSTLQTQTQLDISRAPSPAEARPIKAIPVPEDWVPLAARSWAPQRKYWAAAATCHLPLYFQDPVLERYGHSVEQFVGPMGRYLTYPVDDPAQSTQRNQVVQPFFSAGLFALQIAAWPYNAIMDPPWEAQYDLGYYRPGDMIPVDTYWLPLHGYGPPLRGNRY